MITFYEDPDKQDFQDLYMMANVWVRSNIPHIQIISGIYSAAEDTKPKYLNTEEYRRTIVIRYTGDPIYQNPQTCKHTNLEEVHVDATCIKEGETYTRCKDCNLPMNKTILARIPHDFVFTDDNNATCLTDGTETGVCSKCGKHRKKIRTALGHALPADWTIRKPATITSTGIKFKKCIRCDYEITEIIPKLTHQWVSNGDGTHNCVTEGCCGVINETCFPNGYGETCAKCGYVTPELVLEITTAYVDAMVVDNEFSQQLECNARTGSTTWSVVTGALPAGLTMDEHGLISGTPTSSGIYTFTAQVVWKDQTATKAYSINIANRLCTVTFDPQGGTVSVTSKKVAEGSVIGELPIPTLDGKTFGGWFTAAVDGLKLDTNYTINADVTLYARWGDSSGVDFGDAVSTFNIAYKGDRTNYQNNPYTFYYRVANGAAGAANLAIQTGISSDDRSNNMTATNKTVTLYMKVNNKGAAGSFDIGFDCDSYIIGNSDDRVPITRLANGVSLGSPVAFNVTVPYETSIWVGLYNNRTSNRYNDSAIGSVASGIDTGYAFTMKNIFINSGSYAILAVKFQIP